MKAKERELVFKREEAIVVKWVIDEISENVVCRNMPVKWVLWYPWDYSMSKPIKNGWTSLKWGNKKGDGN
jgi:hypothetical protein